jgi:hypothetical protein
VYYQNSKPKVLTGRGLPRRDLLSAARCPRLRSAVSVSQKSTLNTENLFVICGEISASSFYRALHEIPSNSSAFEKENIKLTKSIGIPALVNDDADSPDLYLIFINTQKAMDRASEFSQQSEMYWNPFIHNKLHVDFSCRNGDCLRTLYLTMFMRPTLNNFNSLFSAI